MKKNSIVLPLILMIVFAASRWPGVVPGNFSAAYAIMFCAGLYFPTRLAWWVPLLTMLVTDVVLNVFAYPDVHFTWQTLGVMSVNYIGYVALLVIGMGLKNGKRSWITLVFGGIVGAFLFYIITNTASWLMDSHYAKSIMGWIQALTTGQPGYPPTWEFFRHTLLSTGLFTGLFAGVVKLLEPSESAEEKREPVPESESEPESVPEPEEAKS